MFKNLKSCKSLHFEKLMQDTLENVEGVYVIFDKSDSALYIGRTKNLRQRLYNNHLHGSESSARLKKYLIADSQICEVNDLLSAKDWIKKNCYFKYIKIKDFKERGKVEGLLNFLLDVRYIHEEH